MLFGAMFAANPFLVAKEMARVTRGGGRIVMGNGIPNDPTLAARQHRGCDRPAGSGRKFKSGALLRSVHTSGNKGPLCPAYCASAGRRREMPTPMVGDVDAATEPHAVVSLHVLQEFDEPVCTPRPANQPVVQTDGQELG